MCHSGVIASGAWCSSSEISEFTTYEHPQQVGKYLIGICLLVQHDPDCRVRITKLDEKFQY